MDAPHSHPGATQTPRCALCWGAPSLLISPLPFWGHGTTRAFQTPPPPFQINGGAVKKIEAITLRSRPPYPRGSPTCRANTANEAGGPFPTSARHSRHRPSEAPPSLGDATLTPHPTATPHREGAAAALGVPSWRCPHCREGLSCSAAFPRGRARPWEAISPPYIPPPPRAPSAPPAVALAGMVSAVLEDPHPILGSR